MRLRQSAMTAIFDNKERHFNFEEDAHLMGQQERAMLTTANRMEMTVCSAATTSKGPQDGKVYKFKNIHGDRGTYEGISKGDHNEPPSSLWRDHPIPRHLMSPKGI